MLFVVAEKCAIGILRFVIQFQYFDSYEVEQCILSNFLINVVVD